MWNLYIFIVVFVLVFLISYKPGSGFVQKWLGIPEKMENEVVTNTDEEYKVTSRDMMNGAYQSRFLFDS